MGAVGLARAHGLFNLATGLWPVLGLRTFEAATGPKLDDWLVKTVGGLLTATGLVELTAPGSPDSLRQTKKLAVGVAGTLTVIDVVYASRRRISPVYFLDAAMQAAWVAAWVVTSPRKP